MMARRVAAVTISLIVATAGMAAGTTVSRASSGNQAGPVTKTKTVTRDNLVNGKNDVVDKRKITLHVSQTDELRGRQEITVSWSGAHPTGGIVADQNSIDAQDEEFPFVLLECRGVDSTKVKASEQLNQKTCWTQDSSERYQDSPAPNNYPPYRLDRYATAADRAKIAGRPKSVPAACKFDLDTNTQRWVPFEAANGHVYDFGPSGCAGEPPESATTSDSALPSNETFGVTGLNGRGTADFDVWTSAENASLGCTRTVACSLVAVPIMGISCDPAATGLPAADRPPAKELAAATSACESKGNFAPGQLMPAASGLQSLTDSGSLWWSASNWRNRISVPLHFAVPADACNAVTSTSSVEVFGSELLIPATGQWAPHFCLNPKLFNFTHVQLGEPEARNLVATGGAEAAFTSDAQPGGYGKTVVSAPVAVTGFAISYVIDGANGRPYTKLRLDARLLAKLLTESYPADLAVQQEDPALSRNPLNITLDPEFQKLNPGITHGVDASEAASALLTLSSDSDVMRALTTYINDDPSARAWLNGEPDPWGMVVDPAYQDIKLPVDQWPLLSTFEPKKFYDNGSNDCLHRDPVPYLPLVAAPLTRLEEISEAMQFANAQSTIVCSESDSTTAGEKLVPLGRQTVGFRFMIGVTSVADSRLYQLRSAALQTTGPTKFVAPSDASMKAAAALLKPDTATGTWPVPYPTLRTAKAAAGAYPGTMVVYAAVPTTGLPRQDAKDYAALLRYLVTTGQDTGLGVGQLPPGYLPLTKANGLESLAAYTYAAAHDVAAQNNELPPMTGNPAPGTPASSLPSGGSSTSPSSTATTSPDATSSTTPTVVGPNGTVSLPPIGSAIPGVVPSPSVAPAPGSTVVAERRTTGIGLGSGGLVVVIIIGVAIVAGLGAPTTYFVGRRLGRW